MAQVSGSIALDLSKIEREIVARVVAELTRPATAEQPAITDLLAVPVLRAIMPTLAKIRDDLVRLEELIRSESRRRDRLAGNTGEQLIVRGPNGEPIYEVSEEALAARGQGLAWAPAEHPIGSSSSEVREQTDRDQSAGGH